MSITSELQFKNYYSEKVYITANVETGVMYNRSGRRMIALTNDFLIGLHRALLNECGDRTEQVLHRCGKKWGVDFGRGMDAEWSQYYEHPAKEFPMAFFQGLLSQEFGHNGWGILTMHLEHFPKGVLWLSLKGAIMSDIYKDEVSFPADALTAGILAGLFTYFLDRDIDCIESQCAKDGHEDSRFILSSLDRIACVRDQGTAGKTHATILDELLETTSA